MKTLISTRQNGNLFDPFFDDFFGLSRRDFSRDFNDMMKTDVEETDDGYCVSIELAGYRKEEISIDLKEGYLTVSAIHSDEDKENDKKKKYVRRERAYTSCKRTFFVGDNVSDTDVNATFENGVLQICIAKAPEKIPENKRIEIK